MRIALVYSLQDEAGVNIQDHIRALLPAMPRDDVEWGLQGVEGRLIDQDNLNLPADLIIFLSRHRSEKPAPVLTVHVTGNFHEAVFGGRSRSLPAADPGWMQAVLRNLAAGAPAPYRVSYEVTHHGPTELSVPSFFVEIGSTQEEWIDPKAGAAVAASVLQARPQNPVPLIGFGGTHYAARETTIALESRGAFGHIAHTREIGKLDPVLVRMMHARSRSLAAYVDRKAVSAGEYGILHALLQEIGIPEIGESELLALGDLDFPLLLEMKEQAETLAPGSHVHPHHLAGTGTVVVENFPSDLLEEATRIGGKEIITFIQSRPCAHITGSDGRLLPIFVTFEEHREALINHLITFCVKLISGCANTAVESDRLIIRRMRFDPRKARDLGIPQEHFGRLAGGQTIELQGRIISPAMVHTGSVREIYIPGLARYL